MPESLFPYQVVGAQWLASKHHALLADEMRLGKTAQAIHACDVIGARRVLVLCPAIARINWLREFERFSTCTRTATALLSKHDASGSPDIVVCSYNLLLQNSISSWLRAKPFDVVIFDEVHYLKNRTAHRTRAAFSVAGSSRCFALSGTPATNHAAELWPLLAHCGVYTQDYWSFATRFCVLVQTVYGTEIRGNQRIPELRALLTPFMLRRKMADVIHDLPPILFSDVVVEAGEVEVERWYPEVATGMCPVETWRKELGGQQAAIEAVVGLTGLGADGFSALGGIQVRCSKTRRYVGLQKTAAVAEILTEELESGAYEKIVVFCIHRDVMIDLCDRLRAFKPVSVFGGTPPDKRVRHLQQFKTNPTCRVFVGNIVAAGVAIDLSVASEIAFVEASWVPGDNAQAAMRCHHILQKRPVRVRFFSLANTSDEKVQKVLRRKTKELTEIFDPALTAPVVNPFDE